VWRFNSVPGHHVFNQLRSSKKLILGAIRGKKKSRGRNLPDQPLEWTTGNTMANSATGYSTLQVAREIGEHRPPSGWFCGCRRRHCGSSRARSPGAALLDGAPVWRRCFHRAADRGVEAVSYLSATGRRTSPSSRDLSLKHGRFRRYHAARIRALLEEPLSRGRPNRLRGGSSPAASKAGSPWGNDAALVP
jgi:hypothetical protein